MGTKAEETAPGADGCLAKAAADEPLFILRAQDKMAPSTVRAWIEYAGMMGTPQEKLAEAEQLAQRMEAWQVENGSKVAD